nr:class I SAM-dependent methyltransferase [Candidatus Njordarchaeum guaymaensis]
MGKRPGLVRYLRNLLKIIFIEIDPWKRIEENLILKLTGRLRNQAICDIACGIGRISDRLNKLGGRVSGIDIDENEVRVGSETSANIDFILGAAEHLPYRSSFFDKAVSVCALEHFSDDKQALKEINRILKKRGTLVLTVDSFSHPNLNQKIISTQRRIYHVKRYYTEETLAYSLKRAGFKVKTM